MPNPTRRLLLTTVAAALAAEAHAQAPQVTRVRGTIAAAEGTAVAVLTRAGPTVTVQLTEPLTIVSLRRVTLEEITPGTSVGAVAEPGPEGTLRATALTVLPPGARIAEAQFAWDTGPETSMNNGPVEAVAERAEGRDLRLSIQGRSVVVRVAPDVPLLMPVPANRADLVAGAAVYIAATRGADDTLSANRVTVGKDGVAPVI